MDVRQAWAAELDPADRTLVEESLAFVSGADTDGVLAGLAPGLTERQRASVAAHCAMAHAAVLVFPASLDRLIAGFRSAGFSVGEPVPSVVVRDRLSLRYGVPADALNVRIVHIHRPSTGHGPGFVELFALEAPGGSEFTGIAARERTERNESHLALDVGAPDDVVLAGLSSLLTEHGGLTADGGGYNAVEDCTVLYFRSPEATPPGSNPDHYRRLELRVLGHHPGALAAHTATATDDPTKRLLELMTGAWTTQAIAVAAELGLADHLPGPSRPEAPCPIGELAERLGVAPDGLTRLLRYLTAAELVTPTTDSYRLTALGELLRRDARHSLRPLALLYGGPFYQSFGALAHAVRTGQEAFATIFGQGHFDYFAEHPALATLFDSAMAASAEMFEPVPGLVDLSDARVVVDVGGGSGELLSRFLAHTPHLRGVLFERAHVLERARQRLADDGHADRCDLVAGDFTQGVPRGGDVYLLSRILHDWDDEQCLAILRRCAADVPEDARLLIVERLLPTDGTSSLAAAWDLHMLCNVGGRERTAEHYARLLSAAGFDLVAISGLPLDGSLLHARRRGSDQAART
ncbi:MULTISPECIES: methyltransferase [Kitasatospora]|uniref:Methyltransferase n=1 Tax=Kitasatospora cystarginea TaxID=58350 RepID=A0ABN3DT26_9ACTN